MSVPSWLIAQAAGPASWSEALEASDGWSLNALKVLIVLGGALLVFAAIRAARVTVPMLPLSRAQRERLGRFGPFAELLAWALYLTVTIAWLLDGQQTATVIVLTILAVTLTAALWSAIRDYLTGVILRVERLARVGDHIRVGDVSGRITHLGTRVAQLQTPDGDTVVLPYSQLTGDAVTRSPRGSGAALHTFVVEAPREVSPAVVSRAIREATILNHWATPRHVPTIRHLGSHTFEVTVQPLTDERAIDLESAVRDAATAVRP